MRETFKSWYPITEAERSEAYHNGHIVLDTSVLLSLYRFRTTARKDVLNLLEKAAGRLWMPYQVGLEFHRNRLKVIDDASHGPGPGLRKAIQDARNKIRDTIQQAASRTRMDKQSLEETAKAAFDSLEDKVATVEAGDVLTLEAAIGGDSVLDALDGLYRDRVGEPFTEDRLKAERSIGHERAKARYRQAMRMRRRAGTRVRRGATRSCRSTAGTFCDPRPEA
jgi:hypothetical protein